MSLFTPAPAAPAAPAATPIHIWMFCGYAGSGKTHAANHLQSILNPSTTYVTAFADAVKEDVAAIYNIPRRLFDTQEGKASLVKTPDGNRKARDLLIDYSLAMKEAYGAAVWAKEVVRRIRSITERQHIEHVIIHDLRFTAEVETMYKEFHSSQESIPPEFRPIVYNKPAVLHTIRIVRPSIKSMPIQSEHDLDDYDADVSIENTGTMEELNSKIEELFHALK